MRLLNSPPLLFVVAHLGGVVADASIDDSIARKLPFNGMSEGATGTTTQTDPETTGTGGTFNGMQESGAAGGGIGESDGTTTSDAATSTGTTETPPAENNAVDTGTGTATGTGTLEVGLVACVEGFVMDFFCINRGTLFDNPSVVSLSPEGPAVHTVHCLIDVPNCNESPYEVLIDPQTAGTDFSRGFRLTDNAKALATDVAMQVGDDFCSECDGTGSLRAGFRAAFEATVVDLGDGDVPPTIDATRVIQSTVEAPTCVDIGLPNILELVDPASFKVGGESNRAIQLTHGSLMMISWGLLLPSGVLIAKFLKHRPDGLWFRIHKPLQLCGLVLALIGWIIALVSFDVFGNKGETNYYHGILGSTVMSIGLLQPINAFLRPHAPEPGQEKPLGRLLWEVLHKSLGWIAVLMAVVTISLGTTILAMVPDQKAFQLAYGIGCGGCLLLLVTYICVDKARFRPEKLPETHGNMQGHKYHS